MNLSNPATRGASGPRSQAKLGNPFRSAHRIVALLILGPATAVAVAGAMVATDYTTFTPTDSGFARSYTVPGWDR
jgi:hypothetical protein